MENILKILNKSKTDLPLPKYATEYSSGLDLMADIEENIIIKPLERVLIPTGVYIELPFGYEAQIRPRSGLAWKHGLSIVNSPGTIDCDYRGEIKIILINLSNQEYEIKQGDRIAQMVITQYSKMNVVEVEELNDTVRGVGGFGHTGIKSK